MLLFYNNAFRILQPPAKLRYASSSSPDPPFPPQAAFVEGPNFFLGEKDPPAPLNIDRGKEGGNANLVLSGVVDDDMDSLPT